MVRALFLIVLAVPNLAQAADIGRVISLRGEATITRSSDGAYQRLTVERGMRVQEGDQLRTRRDAAVRIVFSDRSLLNVGENASAVIQRYQVATERKTRDVGIRLWAGKAWARVTGWFGGETNFEVQTPNAVAGVRGTEFSVDVTPTGETSVTVYEGAVEVGPPGGGVSFAYLNPGERSRVGSDGTTVTESVSPTELEGSRKESQRSGGLDPKNSEKRLNDAQQKLGDAPHGGPGTPAVGPAEGPPGPDDERDLGAPPPPPLDLDPASGASRVRGRVEIRE